MILSYGCACADNCYRACVCVCVCVKAKLKDTVDWRVDKAA